MILWLVALIWAITFHEFCHAWVAWKLGDRTAAYEGRVSLNPLVHFDPMGAMMLLFFRFGWAKPVPINTRHFKNPRRDVALVALAGPGGNLLTAFVVAFLWMGLVHFTPQVFMGNSPLRDLLSMMLSTNIGLAAFNLIPVPPLDGSRVLAAFLTPKALRSYFFLEQYGFYILMGLSFMGFLSLLISPIVNLFFQIIIRVASFPFSFF